ncbi:hypothetical protein IDVR_11030 [Intrasporangium sp. DVR]
MSPHGTHVTPDRSSKGGRRALTLQDFPHLDFVEEVLLPEARARGVLTREADAVLTAVVTDLRLEASEGAVPHPMSLGELVRGDLAPLVPSSGLRPPLMSPPLASPPLASPPLGVPPLRPGPRVPETGARVAPRPSAPPRPSPLRQWWGRTLEAVGSDLAVHGLAYLGVLLFFVGAFGLVAFAFGDVARELRPVAEAVIAAAPFGAGAVLRRRRAEFVGRALELAGGLVLPIMLVTTFLDGVAVPPDLTGGPLVVVLTAVLLLVAGAYAVWSSRVPDSALRFLVAPVAWLAVGLATMGLGRAVPEGKAVANPSAAQVAAMAVALLVTLAWANLRSPARLAEATKLAAIPGLAVIGCLAALTWAAEGAPRSSVLVAGVAVLLSVELLAPRLPRVVPGIAEPLWWLTVWAVLVSGVSSGSVPGLAPDTGPVAATSVLGAAGFLAILERAGSGQRRPAPALLLPAAGLLLTLAATAVEPGIAAAALAVASWWAAARRRAPYHAFRAPMLLDVAAAVLPIAAILALVAATDLVIGAVGAAALLLFAAVPARRGWLVRKSGEHYWALWWSAGTTLAALLALQAWQEATDTREAWWVALAFAVLAVAAAVGPVAVSWRLPVVTVLTVPSWLAAASAFGASDDFRFSVLGTAGLGLVLLAHLQNRPKWSGPPSPIGMTGHVLGTLAVVAAIGASWGGVIAAASATLAWTLTSWLDAKGRSSVGTALRATHPVAGWAPYAFALAGVPLTVSLALDRSGLLPWSRDWAPTVLVVVAVAYALVPRTGVPDRVAAATSWGAFGAVLSAVALAPEDLPAAAAWGGLMVVVGVLPAVRRATLMTWAGWAAAMPTTFLLGRQGWPWFAGLPDDVAVALALVSVGLLLVVGAAAADLAGRSWELRTRPAHDWARAPIGVGAVGAGAGLVVGVGAAPDGIAGWLLVSVGVALLAVAVMWRVGLLAGAAVTVAWSGTVLLAQPVLETRPWIGVAVALALLSLAHLFSMRPGSGPWWSRWDGSLAVASAPVAVSELVLIGSGRPASPVYVAVGLACLAAAVRLRQQPTVTVPLAAVGAVLMLTGAGWAGSGWLALALLVLAMTLSVLGAVVSGPVRRPVRALGAAAAVAAWVVGVDWLGWQDQTVLDASSLAGAGVVAAAALLLVTRIEREWLVVWGGAGALVESGAAAVALLPDDVLGLVPGARASWWIVVGLTVVAVAVGSAPPRVPLPWLHDLAAAFLGLGLLVALQISGLTSAGTVWVLCLAASTAAVGLLALVGGGHTTAWRRPLAGFGVVLTGWALTAGLSADAAAGWALLSAPLAVAAMQAVATGVAYRRVEVQMLGPGLAAAAWIAFALDALDGRATWTIAPIGLAVLVSVGLWRRDRAERGERRADPDIVWLELVGVALLVGPSLALAATESLAHVAVAFALGLGVAAWGVVSKVRRRVAAGVGVALVAVVLLVAVPLVLLLPSWEGAALWVLIAVVGLVAVLVAAFLERGKVAARKGLTRFKEATADWE